MCEWISDLILSLHTGQTPGADLPLEAARISVPKLHMSCLRPARHVSIEYLYLLKSQMYRQVSDMEMSHW